LSWEAIIRGDFQSAQRAARVVTRRFSTAQGTPYLAHLAAKLATRGGAFTKAVNRDISVLKASIGNVRFYSNEPTSLAALVITTRDTTAEADIHAFVASELPRLRSERSSVWPLITNALNGK
jgi:virulence-associated protein VapD